MCNCQSCDRKCGCFSVRSIAARTTAALARRELRVLWTICAKDSLYTDACLGQCTPTAILRGPLACMRHRSTCARLQCGGVLRVWSCCGACGVVAHAAMPLALGLDIKMPQDEMQGGNGGRTRRSSRGRMCASATQTCRCCTLRSGSGAPAGPTRTPSRSWSCRP